MSQMLREIAAIMCVTELAWSSWENQGNNNAYMKLLYTTQFRIFICTYTYYCFYKELNCSGVYILFHYPYSKFISLTLFLLNNKISCDWRLKSDTFSSLFYLAVHDAPISRVLVRVQWERLEFFPFNGKVPCDGAGILRSDKQSV